MVDTAQIHGRCLNAARRHLGHLPLQRGGAAMTAQSTEGWFRASAKLDLPGEKLEGDQMTLRTLTEDS
jgi:hypothetical protein